MSENSSELERKLMSVLSNPEALVGIMNLAKGFTQSESKPVMEIAPDPEPPHGVQAMAPIQSEKLTGKDFVSEKSIGLLLALKPFLSSNKCDKIDTITGILKVALLTDLFK